VPRLHLDPSTDGPAASAADAATGWTSLPITLFPWGPTNVVAGLVQLPTRTALVQFAHRASPPVEPAGDVRHIGGGGQPRGRVRRVDTVNQADAVRDDSRRPTPERR